MGIIRQEVYEVLLKSFPLSYLEEWDNAGLLIGTLSLPVKKIVVALEPALDTIEFAAKYEADILITHHPLIFKPLKNLSDELLHKKLSLFYQNSITYISLHTNLDKSEYGLNRYVASLLNLKSVVPLFEKREKEKNQKDFWKDVNILNKIFNLTKERDSIEPSLGVKGVLAEPVKFVEFVNILKEKLKITGSVRVINKPDDDYMVRKVSICTGAGGGLITKLDKNCGVYITGDITYHNAIYACEKGIIAIDAGHYYTENVCTDLLEKFLKERFDSIEIKKYQGRIPWQEV